MTPTTLILNPSRRPDASGRPRRATLPELVGALMALLLVAVMIGACTEPFCDTNEDCKGGAICSPATGTCVIPDVDAGDAGPGDDAGDAQPPECTDHDQCQSVDAPVCIEEACAPCTSPTQCEDKDADRPYCDGDGHCVQCLDAPQDCGDTSPICAGGTCTPCADGTDECEADYPAAPVCSLGECVQCADGLADCLNPTPVCDANNQCVGCSGDPDCIDRGETGALACDGQSCVECVDSATHCTDPLNPVCDPVTNGCRPCDTHTECDLAGGVCDWDTGGCVDATNILHVDNSGGCDVNGPGGPSTPFCEIHEAIASVSATQNTILVAGGTYDPISFSGAIPVRILTRQSAAIGVSTDSSIVQVYGANAELLLDGFVVRNGIGALHHGVECSAGATVTLIRSEIRDNEGAGINATNCTISLLGSNVHHNTVEGLNASGCTLTMDANTVSSNGGGGLSIHQCDFTITNNIIHSNGLDQSFYGGVYLSVPGTPQVFAHNTVVGNVTNTTGVNAGVLCIHAVELVNTIIHGNADDGVATSCTYTSCWLTMNGDPQLDATTKMLTVNSPCRDWGTAYPAVMYDIEGETRDATPDAGADEYH